MSKLLPYGLHLIIFAAALGIGSIFTTKGLSTGWYATLNLPPWQPPSWTFGAVWTTIMVVFPIAMAILLPPEKLFSLSTASILFWAQWILNILWNYLFFKQHYTGIALIEIIALTLVVGALVVLSFRESPWAGIAALPYLLWLCVATSLNAYIWKMN
jgi:tryptophan-rich sensory protein